MMGSPTQQFIQHNQCFRYSETQKTSEYIENQKNVEYADDISAIFKLKTVIMHKGLQKSLLITD